MTAKAVADAKPCIELDLDEARAEVAVLRSLLDASSSSDKRLRAHLASVRDWIKYAGTVAPTASVRHASEE